VSYYYNRQSRISDVMNDPSFGDYGRLIFPVNTGYWDGSTLEQLDLTWYNYIDPDKTVEIVNYMKVAAERAQSRARSGFAEREQPRPKVKAHADAGDIIFYDIYTEAEKAASPDKRNTGLFFFRGREGAPFAVCNAGGGMVYVGAMHDSFPHALELSKQGYNAFALIYRPSYDTAMADLARAIEYICDHATELGVARSGLPHGFGIGTGTVAEGWTGDAVRFWQSQSETSAIRSTRANDGSKSIYSLNGTRRDSMQRGINIVDGRKIVR